MQLPLPGHACSCRVDYAPYAAGDFDNNIYAICPISVTVIAAIWHHRPSSNCILGCWQQHQQEMHVRTVWRIMVAALVVFSRKKVTSKEWCLLYKFCQRTAPFFFLPRNAKVDIIIPSFSKENVGIPSQTCQLF